MVELDARFPEYGFAQHKGYPTAYHLEKLALLGATEYHRRSFAPVNAHWDWHSPSTVRNQVISVPCSSRWAVFDNV